MLLEVLAVERRGQRVLQRKPPRMAPFYELLEAVLLEAVLLEVG